MIDFERFYRVSGLLKKAQLSKPPILNLNVVKLPYWSCIHYAQNDDQLIGIMSDHPVIRNLDRTAKVAVAFAPVDDSILQGKYVLKNVRVNEIISVYMRTVPKWKRAEFAPSEVKIKSNLLIYNYGLINQRVEYQVSSLKDFYHFLNFFKQVILNIDNIYLVSKKDKKRGVDGYAERNHLIVIESPEQLPSLKNLTNYVKNPTDVSFVNVLKTNERLFVAEIFRWLGDHESIFSILSDEALKHTNFLFTRAGSGLLVNLYILKNMVKRKIKVKNPVELVTGQDFEVLSTKDLQLYFLLMLLRFNTAVDDGIVENLLTEEEIAGLDAATADGQHLSDLEKSLGFGEEDDAPSEKDIQSQFIKDTTDSGINLNAVIKNSKRSRKAKKGEEEEVGAVPSDDPEDIFEEKDEVMEDATKALEALDKLSDNQESIEDNPIIEEVFKDVAYKDYTPLTRDPETNFIELAREEYNKGNISAAELRRFEALGKKFKTIKNPYGEGTLAEVAKIDPKDLEIEQSNKLSENIPGVLDKSFLESSHDKMHRHYIENILSKDVLNMSINLLNAGIAIDSYDVRVVEDIVDSYEIHSVRLVPLRGKPSTLKFRVPRINKDGTFKAGGNINRMRVQRADIPIRKVSPSQVALTSYHSKMWIERSSFAAYNLDTYLNKRITAIATDPESSIIKKINYGNCFVPSVKSPLTFSAISRYFTRIVLADYDFNFNVKDNDEFFGKDVNAVAEKVRDKHVLVGKGKDTLLWMDYDGVIHEASIRNVKSIKPIGTFESLIGLDESKVPVPMAELNIFNKGIPIGVVLAYWLGLGNLLKTLKANYRRVPKGSRLNLDKWEFDVRFKDQTLVFDRRDKATALVMSSWNLYHSSIKNYSVYDFDIQDNFGIFFSEVGIENRYETELTIIRQLWIDPITEGELIRLNEPTDMVLLFLSAVNKLTYDEHPDAMDGLYQRDRGYERISGFVYDGFLRSVRGLRSRRYIKDAAMDMNPEDVWYQILNDQTTGIAEFSNPIHSLKEQEVVVFRGKGGRSGRSMTAAARQAHRSNVGRDSEATIDSGDVATVIYTTANPNYNSVRGTVRYTDKPSENISRVIGTSQLMAPGSEYDDYARRNFISIQNSRTTNSVGATPVPVRSGYERVLAYRVSDMFATVARQKGKVISKTNKVIQVEYEDGTQQEIEIGLRYGKWSGKTMPHEIATNLEVGNTFKADTPLAWNVNFFTLDSMSNGLLYKPGVMGRVILIDDEDTWEDSSAIHERFTKKMLTQRVDERDILLDSNQEIRNLLEIGGKVDNDSILCTIYNPTEGSSEIFGQESIDALREFRSNSPQAKANGQITNIDVFYTGQLEDMSETIRDIVEASNARLYKLNKALKKPAIDGSVDVGTRFSGTVLDLNKVLIRVSILTTEKMDGGSKVVFCYQMKSVVGRTITGRFETESGLPIDFKFSTTSFSKRIVDSGNIVGTTSTLLCKASKCVAQKFRGIKS